MPCARWAVLIAAIASMLAALAVAADWYYVGTSAFTTAPDMITDMNRIIFNSIAVDNAGNVYATANNANNNGVPGDLTIFKTDGTQIDINLNAIGLQGGITRLVTGGDGKVYGLQNWLQIGWSYNSGTPNRVLQISSDGMVTQIFSPGAASDANRIGGIAVGGDGNVYWSTNSGDAY